ncbi:MAG: hypothetical protein PHT80_14280, partial [Lentisphaeria bacterium]|nr:hypothetical protein [Lentisphaeria bacterium]
TAELPADLALTMVYRGKTLNMRETTKLSIAQSTTVVVTANTKTTANANTKTTEPNAAAANTAAPAAAKNNK